MSVTMSVGAQTTRTLDLRQIKRTHTIKPGLLLRKRRLDTDEDDMDEFGAYIQPFVNSALIDAESMTKVESIKLIFHQSLAEQITSKPCCVEDTWTYWTLGSLFWIVYLIIKIVVSFLRLLQGMSTPILLIIGFIGTVLPIIAISSKEGDLKTVTLVIGMITNILLFSNNLDLSVDSLPDSFNEFYFMCFKDKIDRKNFNYLIRKDYKKGDSIRWVEDMSTRIKRVNALENHRRLLKIIEVSGWCTIPNTLESNQRNLELCTRRLRNVGRSILHAEMESYAELFRSSVRLRSNDMLFEAIEGYFKELKPKDDTASIDSNQSGLADLS